MTADTPSLAAGLLRTLLSTLGVAGVALAMGLLLGTIAARRAGFFDELLRRLVELSGALPIFVAIPLLARIWPASLSTIGVLGIVHGLRLATICRNETGHVNAEGFVAALRSLGLSAERAHWKHAFPLVAPPIGIGLLLVLPWVVGVEAALGYLGLDASASCGLYLITRQGAVSLPLLLLLTLGLALLHALVERQLARQLGTRRP